MNTVFSKYYSIITEKCKCVYAEPTKMGDADAKRKENPHGKERLTEKGVPYGARQRMPIWYGAV